ncbi:glycosyltransferase [Sphingomonas sp. MAH-20]|uniref:Glycosyltransferase n=1 Tax=Sphingomonas horti TaxID=2682842 RepID=A0A6I4J222_9SPHN|nr:MULTISPECIES: glycosyltransferase family 1 protein [Sphingomonas]MBA2920615.1 glycosyltransferase family 1 protein [Sphingomonas sp. CGMCC 1.13658]MVO77551.1 glycosyltransferase [Sphingomonas horti]
MRIALFSGNYNYLKEGANQALDRLAAHLEAHGHQVRAYSPVTDTPAFEPAGTLIPVPSIRLPVRGEFRLALGLPRHIRSDIERFAPDIVHVSTPDILDTRAQTFAKRLRVPVVASQHTLFETYLAYYALGWARPLVEAHLRRFYRRADHVLAPTPALVEDMKRLRGDDRASVWSRGVDRALFDPARRDMDWRREYGVADDDVAVLFFGRLVLEKGVDIYVAALRALLERGVRVRPLVVGAGPAESAFAALPGAVLTGHLEKQALARAVASADLMLTPSLTETFGNVVLEAMASGLPVVSADAPSARALVEGGHTGLLCSPLDVQAYADAVAALASDPDRRRTMGAAARKASAAYSWDAASESVLQAYRQVLALRSPG